MVKFIDKKAFASKVACALINDWKKLWEPGKKCGLDIGAMVSWMHENHPELVKGDLENMGHRQYKSVVRLAASQANRFPFGNKEQDEAFQIALVKSYEREMA